MSDSVTTILFDLDETLCEYPRSGATRLSNAFERSGVEPCFTYDEYRRAVREIGGTESDIRRRESCFRALAKRNGRTENEGLRVADAYEAVTDYTAMQKVAGAESTLSALDEEYRLGLVTNGGPDTQSPKIDALGFRDRFETIVLAGYETPAKPHPEPFERAMAELDATPDGTVYVGNSLSSDVAGANECGITSVWKPHDTSLDSAPEPNADCGATPAREAAPDIRIRSLQELLEAPWGEPGIA